MKKLIGFAFKLVAAPLLIAGLLVIAIGGLILNGPAETSQKVSELAMALKRLNK